MIVSINQPAYFPWAGYFDRILKSDLHIVLDHVQFEKNSLTNRNKIKTAQGWSWLTVPVKTKGQFKDCPIKDLEINNDLPWTKKHYQTILQNYKKAPYFENYKDFFEKFYNQECVHLNNVLMQSNDFLMKQLNITTPMKYSAALNPQKTKSDLVLELCQAVGATTYLSGPFGRDYLDRQSFAAAGIKILFHDYKMPEYPQLYTGFEPFMSVIDMLLNCGQDSHKILQNPMDSLKTE